MPDRLMENRKTRRGNKEKEKVRQCRALSHQITAPTRCYLLVPGSPLNAYAAVGCHCFDGWTARTEIYCQLLRPASIHGDGEIDADAAVHGSGFPVRRIILRHQQNRNA